MEQVAKQVSQHESERRNRGLRYGKDQGTSILMVLRESFDSSQEVLQDRHDKRQDRWNVARPYGTWIVVPPMKHATRTEKQRNLQSSRAVNGKVNIV